MTVYIFIFRGITCGPFFVWCEKVHFFYLVGSQLPIMASFDKIGRMTWLKWNAFNEKIKKACEIVKKADKDGYVSRTPEQEAELLSCREIVDDLPSLAVRMAFIRDTLEHEDKGLEHETIVKACLTELDDGTLEFDPFQAMKMVEEKEKKEEEESLKTGHVLCPRCIEEHDDEEGNRVSGAEVPSKCFDCGVCRDCDHFDDCEGQKGYFASDSDGEIVEGVKMIDHNNKKEQEDENKVTFEKVKDYTRIKLGGCIGHWAEYTELHDVLGDPQYGPDVNLDGQNNTCEWVLKFSDGYVVRIYDYGVDRGTVHGKTDRSGMHWHLLSVPDMPQGYQNFWDLFKDENV